MKYLVLYIALDIEMIILLFNTEDLKTFERGGLARVLKKVEGGNGVLLEVDAGTVVRIMDDTCFDSNGKPTEVGVKDVKSKLKENQGNGFTCFIQCSYQDKVGLVSYDILSYECGYSRTYEKQNPFTQMHYHRYITGYPIPNTRVFELYPLHHNSLFQSIVSTCFRYMVINKPNGDKKNHYYWILAKDQFKQADKIEGIKTNIDKRFFSTLEEPIQFKDINIVEDDPTCYVFGKTINENPNRIGFVPCYDYCNLDDALKHDVIFKRIGNAIVECLYCISIYMHNYIIILYR